MANTTEAKVVAVPITGNYVPIESRIDLFPIHGIPCDPDGYYRVAMHMRPCKDCPIHLAGCRGMHPLGIGSRAPFTGTVIKGTELEHLHLIATAQLEGENIDKAKCLQEGSQVSLHVTPVNRI